MIIFLRKSHKKSCARSVAEGVGVKSVTVNKEGVFRGTNLIKRGGVLLNYGVGGDRYHGVDFLCPVINPWVQLNKYQWLNLVSSVGVICPESSRKKDHINNSNREEWLLKPYYSRGGIGIDKFHAENSDTSNYAQRYIQDRKYEVRVSFFNWLPKNKWLVWKRIMMDENNKACVAWNHKQGGTFVFVNHPQKYDLFNRILETVTVISDTFHLSFGAVDFIVDQNNKHWFIEVNTSPGFSMEENEKRYIECFKALVDLPYEDQVKYAVN